MNLSAMMGRHGGLDQIGEVTLENVHFQRAKSYFPQLIEAVAALRANPKEEILRYGTLVDIWASNAIASDAIARSGITEVLAEGVGSENLVFLVDNDKDINAMAGTPVLDINNPVYRPNRRARMDQRTMIARLHELKRAYEGGVDLTTGKLKGDFKNERIEVIITTGMLLSNMTDEEVAAILLHEMGHAVNAFIYLGRTAVVTAVAREIQLAWQDNLPKETKVAILGVISEMSYVPGMDADAMASADGDTAAAIYLDTAARSPISLYDTAPYDLANFEAMADQYAIRLGGGRALSSGMRKMFRPDVPVSRTRLGGMVQRFFSSLTGAASRTVIMLSFYTPEGTYDAPAARLERMRREMISSLRYVKSVEERKAIDEAIVSMTKDIDLIGKDLPLSRFFNEIGGWHVATAERKMQIIQNLEKLANNELALRNNRLSIALGR